jgi:hypothetical protein
VPATPRARRAFCSTRRIAVPRRAISASASMTAFAVRGARPSDGSSRRSSRGRRRSARPRASICCWPPDSDSARCDPRSRRTGKSASTVSRSDLASGAGRPQSAAARFSRTVSSRKRPRSSGTYTTPRRAIRSASIRSMRSPSSSTVPFRGWSFRRPAMLRRRVVLPAPLGPRTARISPASSSTDAPASAMSRSKYAVSIPWTRSRISPPGTRARRRDGSGRSRACRPR